MKKNFTIVFVIITFLFVEISIAQTFTRKWEIPVPSIENCGFGGFVAGVDFDGDGKLEIYAVNNNWTDVGAELIPRMYKYELNNNVWELVWSTETSIPKQNTWPPLIAGDMDNDGKMEMIWGPVNFTDATNPNPPRVLVFESNPPNEEMGVLVGSSYVANTQWSIVDQNDFNLRPIRWVLTDIDGDGTKELVFGSRVSGHRWGVISVTDVPDGGAGFESWTLEASGLGQSMDAGVIYDMCVLGSKIYLFHENGNVTPVTYSGGSYTIGPAIANACPGGSWKSACVVDIDEDGVYEIVAAGWTAGNNKIYLLQESGGTLTTSQIADMSPLIGTGRLYGGASGDIDNDGKLDFVFGTRDATPNAAILRLSYIGGPITSPSSYVSSIIDHSLTSTGGRWDLVQIVNLDSDPYLEVVYSNGIGGMNPIVILDLQASSVGENNIPEGYSLQQNYPNPFNPNTTISYSIPTSGFVSLKVYDLLGNEIAALVNEEKTAGSYSVNFDASNLSSGVYFYKLFAGNYFEVKKMNLMK